MVLAEVEKEYLEFVKPDAAPAPPGFMPYDIPVDYRQRLGEVVVTICRSIVSMSLTPATLFALVPMKDAQTANGLLLERGMEQGVVQFDEAAVKEALTIKMPTPRHLMVLVDTPVKSFLMAVDVDFAAKQPIPSGTMGLIDPSRAPEAQPKLVLTLVKGSSAVN
jgi:hypothetical protein